MGPSTAGFNADCGIRGLQFVNVCEHDTASAFIGSPLGERAVVISSGTWALVGVEAPAPVIDEFTFAANIANEGGPEGHHRVLRNVMGMWLIQELKRDYERSGQRFSFPEIADMAAAAAPFAFPIDPDDPEFYLPGDMRDKVRRVSLRENGCAPETPAEFFRCVYEALAMKYRWVVELLETAVGRRYEVINIIGGGCQDKLLDQFTANACAREVQAGPADASAIGNLLMQMVAMGEVADIPPGAAWWRAASRWRCSTRTTSAPGQRNTRAINAVSPKGEQRQRKDEQSMKDKVVLWAEELQSLAQAGLFYGKGRL